MDYALSKAKKIDGTLESMDLDSKDKNCICISHPRTVLQWKTTLSIQEDGEVNVSTSETRMECLFRHFRNSLAHNRTYVFTDIEKGDTILLEDADEASKKISARILIKTRTLLDWIDVVQSKKQSDVQEESIENKEELTHV